MNFRVAIFMFFALSVGCASTPPKTVVLDHRFFEVHYSPEHKLPKFVKYTLTAENLKRRDGVRRDKFFADPLLIAQNIEAVGDKDYRHSGYARGHMAPAEDFRYSQEAVDATFVMTNMAPQTNGLNSGAWAQLEKKVRRLACGEEKVTVITGPILEPNLEKLKSGVSVPKQFFKMVVDETPPRKAMAFIYNQTDRGNLIEKRMVSFSELESKTGGHYVSEWVRDINVRQPAQINEWKEKDCRSEMPKRSRRGTS